MHQDIRYSVGFGQDDYMDDDDDFFNNDPNDSDEDTVEASETEISRSDEQTELKEQIYQDKLMTLKKQLQQLQDGTHPVYHRKLKRLEAEYKERLRLNIIHKDYLIACVERDYVLEKRAASKELDEKKAELKENLLADIEEKRKVIEAERFSLELNGDSTEIKPAMTRKLRRRPNDPIPEKIEKRRKLPPAQISYLLEDKEIEKDLKIIKRGKSVPQIQKTVVLPHYNPQNITSEILASSHGIHNVETKIEDGKLLYERRWFHRGQTIYVEGKDLPRFPANISAIGIEAIWVKKDMDNSKIRIYISELSSGKITIKRRAP